MKQLLGEAMQMAGEMMPQNGRMKRSRCEGIVPCVWAHDAE
jgi:hypothetical protein